MAEGGPAPLQDPGGLHMYSMNGTGHKLAELVPESPGPQGAPLGGIYAGLSSPYHIETSMHQGGSFMHGEGYGDNGVYTDIKRPIGIGQNAFSFTDMDTLQQHHHQQQQLHQPSQHSSVNMFDGMSTYSVSQDINTSIPGYVDMLSDSGITIKREKLDYDESIGEMMHNSTSPDIPYPPNTCVPPEWNFFNPVSGSSQFHGQQTCGFDFQGHLHQPYTNNMMYNNTQATINHHIQTNDDIHQKAMKISQTILSSEWGNSNLYKPTLYKTLATDQPTRKRRSDENKPKASRAKRKKSSELGSHSKSVASILMSNSSPSASNGSKSPDGALDSSDRSALVSTLMNNLRSTVQFESFILSFPRSAAKEKAFHTSVSSNADLINNLDDQIVMSHPFPSKYLSSANKVITNFKNALENTSAGKVHCEGETADCVDLNLRNEQVEEHLPHSMVWVVKLGDKMLTANWEGQLVVGINPVQKTLSFSVFQFQPNFSAEGIKCLQLSKLTKELADEIVFNMEQFEVSRQLRCDINLKTVTQLYLFQSPTGSGDGCLILEMSEKPTFHQKWLHTSADDRNKWRQRENFFSKSDLCENEVIYIGGFLTELNELLALILASDHDLEELYAQGVSKTYMPSPRSNNNFKVNGGNGEIKLPENRRNLKVRKNGRKLGSNLQKLRQEVVAVLDHHSIVHENGDRAQVTRDAKNEKDEAVSGISLGIQLAPGQCACLQDYVNFSCDSATELNTLLEKEVQPRAYGFYENDFDMSKVPDRNIDQIKLGELISTQCSEVVYYSFCKKEVGQLGYEKHCVRCHTCRTMKFWHCETCDQCTQARSVCEFCGHLRNDQTQSIIKPLSVFKSQVSATGVVTSNDIKKEWMQSLQENDNDVITLEIPYPDNSSVESVEYNSQNAMVDQLGLLNPVGFLLGQHPCGASRKHRRHKGGQPNDIVPNSKKGAQKESGCSLQ